MPPYYCTTNAWLVLYVVCLTGSLSYTSLLSLKGIPRFSVNLTGVQHNKTFGISGPTGNIHVASLLPVCTLRYVSQAPRDIGK